MPWVASWDVDEGVRLYEQGMSLNQLSAHFGKSVETIRTRLIRRGVQMRSRANKGPANGKWTGGRNVDKGGYILVYMPDHPMATKAGYVREHRLVVEKILGRYLTATEVVHHADDDPGNNDPSNLILFETNGQHLAETLVGKVPNWTEDGKRRIREGVQKARKQKTTPDQ